MTKRDRRGPDPVDREAMHRVMRRLNVLETLILGAAAILALLGGALVAWLLHAMVGTSFRVTWAVASLLFFVVPGAVVYAREKLAPSQSGGGEAEPRTGEGDD